MVDLIHITKKRDEKMSSYIWVLLVAVYGICKGSREIFKKIALRKSTVMETLFMYVCLSFVMVLPYAGEAFRIENTDYMYLILIKSFVIFVAWICSFKALSKMPVSLYGVLDLSRIIFSTLYGIILLSERIGIRHIAGLFLVSAGLLLLKFRPFSKNEKASEKVDIKIVITAFLGCALTALSGALDKILMRKGDLTSGQLQFWYMLFLVFFYALYIIFTHTKIDFKSTLKNKWVYLMSLTLVIGDKALFVANNDPDCTVTLMTLIKQISCIVVILGGKFVFKEKRILYKLICAAVIICGIVIAVVK